MTADLGKGHHRPSRTKRPDFKAVAAAALQNLPGLLEGWLPDGRRVGQEWVALNPKRPDRHLGSFRINIRTGKWADFAIEAKGGDAISLAAYLFDLSQADAARKIARTLGVDVER
jgi:hypothetical protein